MRTLSPLARLMAGPALVAALALFLTMLSTSWVASSRLLIVVGYTPVNCGLVVKISTT